MNGYYHCQCGCFQFHRSGERIICTKCQKPFENNDKIGFLSPSDSKAMKFITKLGVDIGVEAVTTGASVLIGITMPWALPFALTAFGIVLTNGGEALFDLLSEKFFNDDSYGKCITGILETELKRILKKGKKESSYNVFYNYHLYCSNHYSEVITFLLDNKKSTDIYSDEAINAIVSEEFGYPGHKETGILDRILQVAYELQYNFEKKVKDDKNIGLRWQIEKAVSEQEKKLSSIIKLLTSNYKDNSVDDDTYEYIKNYNRSFFLDTNTDITLGKMYLEPQDDSNGLSASKAISDWCEKDEKLLFVYGAAGVGKTSLITKIISDIYGISGQDSIIEFDKAEVHPIILRDKVSDIIEKAKRNNYSALSVLKSIINIPDCSLDGHLIILDGFDELCILANEFDDKIFIKKLVKDLESTDIKVIITSRPMSEITYYISLNVSMIRIIWTESQIIEWCDKFSKLTKSDEEKEWCESFKSNYSALLKNNYKDSRLEMFSVPIILYLACKSNTIISKDDTIGEFYDHVFRTIANRKHSEHQKSSSVYIGAEQERLSKLVNWQFTKELAYQMFLNDTLSLTNYDKYGINRIEYAKKRTIVTLRERGENISEDFEIDTESYLAISYFANGKEKGIEFAHKTVYEYFTAVKLYEDYFAGFNAEYFKTHDKNTAIKEVWQRIIEAFRYTSIPEDIFNYLNEMSLPLFNGFYIHSVGFDYESFEKCYIAGMKSHILSDISIPEQIDEYKASNAYINTQVCTAFRNLTWFLTGHGFCNKDNNDCCKEFSELTSSIVSDFNCANWNLYGIDLQDTYLKGAIFQNANLQYTDLIRTNLSNANLLNCKLDGSNMVEADLSNAQMSNASLIKTSLAEADLRGCFLELANLTNACFESANLENAILLGSKLVNVDFSNANLHNTELYRTDLRGANLSTAYINETKLDKAKYCTHEKCKTVFPNDFDPKEHQMVEVDIGGNPIST